MADMLEYIKWRGDIPFSQVPLTPVDNLILSTLVYLDFSGLVGEDLRHPVPLRVAAEAFFALPDHTQRIRVKPDLALLRATADAPRFRDVELSFYRDIFIPEEETQFAAMAYHIGDGTVFLAFRGTDTSLVGWKEDFNMTFQDFVPAQREALRFTREFADACPSALYLGGHSKGGNLAVFAAATCGAVIQRRILGVYNNDGPGFTQYLMGNPGYLTMVPVIHTYIPQSSIIGILLEHEEPYTVIKSNHVSVLQHEPHSWEIQGGDFVRVQEMSAETRFLDKTIKKWLSGIDREERGKFVDAVYALLTAGGAGQTDDILHPRNIHAFFKALSADDATRKMLFGELSSLLRSANEIRAQSSSKQEAQK